MLSHKAASIFLFLEGFASVAIQFLILRQLTPFVGSSVIIVSIVISIFLAALAVGYHRGGLVTKRHTEILSRNLFIAATILGIFGSYIFIAGIYRTFNHMDAIILLLGYLLLVMVPIVYLVAQTIPILVNSMSAKTAGKKTGDALLFSTVGNVFGGILTTVVIMYYLGVSWALVFTVTILFILSLVISEHKKSAFLLFVLFFPLIVILNIGFGKYFFVAETAYANYRVKNEKGNRYFLANRSYSSKIDINNKEGYAYLEKIKKIIAGYAPYMKDPNILVLGAGGFTLTADDTLKIPVHYVDIDIQIKEIAEKYFLQEKIKGTFSGKDARIFLRDINKKYSFIVVDAYSNRKSIPDNLTSIEFYLDISKKLKPNGLMISNIIMDPFLSDDFSKRMDNTIRAAFRSCFRDVVQAWPGSGNVLYVCTNLERVMASTTDTIYKDNSNKAAVDYFKDRVQD
jgi:predicted membrane-bound spermidine synthase